MGMKLAWMLAPLIAVQPAAAASMRSTARELAAGAHRSGIATVAVLPLSPADGSLSAEGWNLSERLLTQLVRSGKVRVVERAHLSRVLSEHQLSRSGAIEPKALKALGRLLAADAVVMGSFVTSGRRARLQARLVNVETGLIVAASETETSRDDSALAGWGGSWNPTLEVPAPELNVEAPMLELRDAPRDSVDCARAAERVDRLESRVLDLKARYWALRLRQGLDARSLKQNPGSIISDPELKKEFYARMTAWYRAETIPEITPVEASRLLAVDGEAFALHQECGL